VLKKKWAYGNTRLAGYGFVIGCGLDAGQHLNQLTDFHKIWYDSATEVYPSLAVFNDL
jgi:hypothetical protein